jgi:hypothetical protein
MLNASPLAAYCLPAAGQSDSSPDTRELDHLLAMHFRWWDVLVGKKSAIQPPIHQGVAPSTELRVTPDDADEQPLLIIAPPGDPLLRS